eukprot:1897688-Prymnesium_polylepis.1
MHTLSSATRACIFSRALTCRRRTSRRAARGTAAADIAPVLARRRDPALRHARRARQLLICGARAA